MHKPKWQFLVMVGLFLSMGCKKDNDENALPKATQVGANTFGCKVDGVVYKPHLVGGLWSGNYLSVQNNRAFNRFEIETRNQKTYQTVILEFTFMQKPGTYQLRQSPFRGIYDDNYEDGADWYQTDNAHTGELKLTRCDTINNIYAGTFAYTAKHPVTGKLVRITDGRFDLKQ